MWWFYFNSAWIAHRNDQILFRLTFFSLGYRMCNNRSDVICIANTVQVLVMPVWCSDNLGQNKMEQLSPIPPKQWWRHEGVKNVPFWHHWNGGRGGPDVPFILSKIVGEIIIQQNICIEFFALNIESFLNE